MDGRSFEERGEGWGEGHPRTPLPGQKSSQAPPLTLTLSRRGEGTKILRAERKYP
jgi:hypothetical protein